MKYSKLFGKTIKSAPKDATLASHKLLYQGGFIRESVAGRYYLLPLGLLAHEKIKKIIKEAMDNTGAQELLAPVLHPKELWKETNRTNSVGFELMSIKDRNEAEFVLGGTAEEMLVDLVRKFQLSYKDLPFNLYQFSLKFRDELRARGGLLRLREFVMKDAYSFHTTEEDFKKEYEKMKRTYTKIFKSLGLETYIVASDNGYIGGEYCHEFIVESDAGESKFLMTQDGNYAAHEDVATFIRDEKNLDEKEKELEEVEAVRGTTMEDGVKLHKKPLWQQIKDVLFVDEKGRFILAIIRGDYDVNEVKLLHLIKAYQLRHATEEEIHSKIHSEPGFISPVGIKDIVEKNIELIVIADTSLRTVKNAYGGANKKHRDLFNMNIDRDYQADMEGDIALAKEGFVAENGKPLIAKKGIEVGNVFQLGFHYSSKMKGAAFKDANGEDKPYYMGCYGIGLARTLAAIVETHYDDKGIVWPAEVAPYQVHLVAINMQAEEIYKKLEDAGVEVLYDDRDASAGEKFADADLIGIPVRLVVSSKTGDKIEFKKRTEKNSPLRQGSEGQAELLTLEEVLQRLKM
ncbi:MAG TPA: proline--tRNA ligase [Candidatus Saccharimonadales bacterium]|nr:proline--tRNA ligase [Candidatus Saccharimonadales bacterium]